MPAINSSSKHLSAAASANIQAHFNIYHQRFKEITLRARTSFEVRDWIGAQDDAAERLALYGRSIDRVETQVRELLGERVGDKSVWHLMKADYAARIGSQSDWELAETFFNSITRRIFATVGVDPKIEFVSSEFARLPSATDANVCRRYPADRPLEDVLMQILRDCRFETGFADLEKDARSISQRVAASAGTSTVEYIDVAADIFYRGMEAYVIGRITTAAHTIPMVLAVQHPPQGLKVAAVILDEDGISILFSFTRAYFHVLTDRPFELVAFLKTILPRKRVAELYTAIGYNKHGKTVLYRDILAHTTQCGGDQFTLSRGRPGMVMIVFNMSHDDLVIKLIRDRFQNPKATTRQQVLQKYDLVFKLDRAGRLVESHPFEYLRFERCWFAEELLEQLLSQAAQTVRQENDHVVIDHAYVQRRVTPLDIYLHEADRRSAEAAVIEYGNAIKDLAVSNIFPGDMLLQNFGVTRHGRVVFYDYDELSRVDRCNFRKIPNAHSMAAELSEEPWYFVDVNDVFPEELQRFLGLRADLKKVFLDHHAELFDVAFWQQAQLKIRTGETPFLFPYAPQYCLP
jgi:isocitrate dehydrogenase kinase/phosphatase